MCIRDSVIGGGSSSRSGVLGGTNASHPILIAPPMKPPTRPVTMILLHVLDIITSPFILTFVFTLFKKAKAYCKKEVAH